MPKTFLRVRSLLLMLIVSSSLLWGCAPAANFSGEWITNLGRLTLTQTGTTISGEIAGYGGQWNEPVKGTLNGSEADLATKPLENLTLLMTGDTFRNSSPDLSFCGIRRTVSEQLPAGCGFSGRWNLPSNNFYPAGTYMLLTQVAENVSGRILDGAGKELDSITGSLIWGKGWKMEGTTTLDPVTFVMNSAETGFEIKFDAANSSHLCAVRQGQPSAYLGYFACQP
jgi:hypothetical protein